MKKDELRDENNLGFGHFSTAKTEHDWKTKSYDGMESSRSLSKSLDLDKLSAKDINELIKMLTKLKEEKKK